MRIRPKNGHVLVEILNPPETVRGIFIPETHQTLSNEAVVVDTGQEGVSEVDVGNKVIIRPIDGQQLRYFGRNFKLIAERDILAVTS